MNIRLSRATQKIRSRMIFGVIGLAITKWAPQSRPRATWEILVWPVMMIAGTNRLASPALRRTHSRKS